VVTATALPLLFVAYTAGPFVFNVYLVLPETARISSEALKLYLANLPPTATLRIETQKFNLHLRRTEATVRDLVPAQSKTRPISFMYTKAKPAPWYDGFGDRTCFYAPEKSGRAQRTHRYFPEVWDQVFAQIKKNGPTRT
jgi:hypothetical protein